MAKMFYTLEEAAAKLGISTDAIKQMANAGKLQQFRDRDNLMFKREQVDAMSAGGSGDSAAGASATGEIELAGMDETGAMASPADTTGGTGEISLSDFGDTGELDSTGELATPASAKPASPASPADSGTGEYALADSAAGGDIVSIDPGDADLDASGMGGSVLGGSGLRGSELGGGDELGGIGSGMGSSGLLSGLGSGLGSSGAGSGLGSSGLLGDDIGLSGEGDGTGLIDLAEDPSSARNGDAKQASGISVFDADEVDHSDPMAQTIVADSADFGSGMDAAGSGGEELALDSVGSGSGLLDLTREADDTSLGAELLDEIYPAAETTADTKMDSAGATSSGVFDGSVTLEAKDASGVELPDAVEAATKPAQTDAATMEGAAEPARPVYYSASDWVDPAASGMSSGMLMVAVAVLVVGAIVSIFAIGGIPSVITTKLVADQNTLYIAAGAAAGVAIVFGVVGMMVGKVMGR
jgi:hypothetical protein